MAIEIPRNRLAVRQIQTQKRTVPLQQIIDVQGQNPLATGIETAGNVIGQTLQKRAELQRQGIELAKLESLGQVPAGSYAGLDPQTAQTFAMANMRNAQEEKAKPYGTPFVGKDGKSYGYVFDPKTNDFTAKELPQGVPPPKEKKTQDYYFVDSASRKMFDRNMQPIALAPEGATPKIISDPYAGSEFARRGALSQGALSSVNDSRDLMNDSVLNELKAIKFTPGKIYAQIASSEGKELYRNMYNAMSNLLYLKTGATANPTEIENQMIAYMPAANDSVADMKSRLNLLEREASMYQKPTRSNDKPGLKTIEPRKPNMITPKKQGRFIVEEVQ